MPITVNYQPRAALAGKVAALAGQGQFQQKRDQFARNIDEFDASLSEKQRQFDGRQDLGYDTLAANQANQQQRAGLEQMKFQAQQENTEYNRDLQQRQEHAAFQEKGMDNLDAIASQTIGAMGKLDLDKEGERIRDKMGREYQAIQRGRMTMTPDSYRQVLDQWADKVESHGILNGAYDKPPMSPQQKHEANSYKSDDGATWTEKQNGEWDRKDPITADAPDNKAAMSLEFEKEQYRDELKQKAADAVIAEESVLADKIAARRAAAYKIVELHQASGSTSPMDHATAMGKAKQDEIDMRTEMAKEAKAAALLAKPPEPVAPPKKPTPEEEFPDPGQRFDNPIEIKDIDEVPEGKQGWYSDGEYLYLVREDGTRIQKKL